MSSHSDEDVGSSADEDDELGVLPRTTRRRESVSSDGSGLSRDSVEAEEEKSGPLEAWKWEATRRKADAWTLRDAVTRFSRRGDFLPALRGGVVDASDDEANRRHIFFAKVDYFPVLDRWALLYIARRAGGKTSTNSQCYIASPRHISGWDDLISSLRENGAPPEGDILYDGKLEMEIFSIEDARFTCGPSPERIVVDLLTSRNGTIKQWVRCVSPDEQQLGKVMQTDDHGELSTMQLAADFVTAKDSNDKREWVRNNIENHYESIPQVSGGVRVSATTDTFFEVEDHGMGPKKGGKVPKGAPSRYTLSATFRDFGGAVCRTRVPARPTQVWAFSSCAVATYDDELEDVDAGDDPEVTKLVVLQPGCPPIEGFIARSDVFAAIRSSTRVWFCTASGWQSIGDRQDLAAPMRPGSIEYTGLVNLIAAPADGVGALNGKQLEFPIANDFHAKVQRVSGQTKVLHLILTSVKRTTKEHAREVARSFLYQVLADGGPLHGLDAHWKVTWVRAKDDHETVITDASMSTGLHGLFKCKEDMVSFEASDHLCYWKPHPDGRIRDTEPGEKSKKVTESASAELVVGIAKAMQRSLAARGLFHRNESNGEFDDKVARLKTLAVNLYVNGGADALGFPLASMDPITQKNLTGKDKDPTPAVARLVLRACYSALPPQPRDFLALSVTYPKPDEKEPVDLVAHAAGDIPEEEEEEEEKEENEEKGGHTKKKKKEKKKKKKKDEKKRTQPRAKKNAQSKVDIALTEGMEVRKRMNAQLKKREESNGADKIQYKIANIFSSQFIRAVNSATGDELDHMRTAFAESMETLPLLRSLFVIKSTTNLNNKGFALSRDDAIEACKKLQPTELKYNLDACEDLSLATQKLLAPLYDRIPDDSSASLDTDPDADDENVSILSRGRQEAVANPPRPDSVSQPDQKQIKELEKKVADLTQQIDEERKAHENTLSMTSADLRMKEFGAKEDLKKAKQDLERAKEELVQHRKESENVQAGLKAKEQEARKEAKQQAQAIAELRKLLDEAKRQHEETGDDAAADATARHYSPWQERHDQDLVSVQDHGDAGCPPFDSKWSELYRRQLHVQELIDKARVPEKEQFVPVSRLSPGQCYVTSSFTDTDGTHQDSDLGTGFKAALEFLVDEAEAKGIPSDFGIVTPNKGILDSLCGILSVSLTVISEDNTNPYREGANKYSAPGRKDTPTLYVLRLQGGRFRPLASREVITKKGYKYASSIAFSVPTSIECIDPVISFDHTPVSGQADQWAVNVLRTIRVHVGTSSVPTSAPGSLSVTNASRMRQRSSHLLSSIAYSVGYLVAILRPNDFENAYRAVLQLALEYDLQKAFKGMKYFIPIDSLIDNHDVRRVTRALRRGQTWTHLIPTGLLDDTAREIGAIGWWRNFPTYMRAGVYRRGLLSQFDRSMRLAIAGAEVPDTVPGSTRYARDLYKQFPVEEKRARGMGLVPASVKALPRNATTQKLLTHTIVERVGISAQLQPKPLPSYGWVPVSRVENYALVTNIEAHTFWRACRSDTGVLLRYVMPKPAQADAYASAQERLAVVSAMHLAKAIFENVMPFKDEIKDDPHLADLFIATVMTDLVRLHTRKVVTLDRRDDTTNLKDLKFFDSYVKTAYPDREDSAYEEFKASFRKGIDDALARVQGMLDQGATSGDATEARLDPRSVAYAPKTPARYRPRRPHRSPGTGVRMALDDSYYFYKKSKALTGDSFTRSIAPDVLMLCVYLALPLDLDSNIDTEVTSRGTLPEESHKGSVWNDLHAKIERLVEYYHELPQAFTKSADDTSGVTTEEEENKQDFVYSGIGNIGNTCYLAAAMQALTSALVESGQELSYDEKDPTANRELFDSARTFVDTLKKGGVPTEDQVHWLRCLVWGIDPTNAPLHGGTRQEHREFIGPQQDATEAVGKVINTVDDKPFRFRVNKAEGCSNCQRSRKTAPDLDTYMCLNLDRPNPLANAAVPGTWDSVEHAANAIHFEDVNDRKCTFCRESGGVSIERHVATCPQILVVQLKRYESKGRNRLPTKITTPIKVNLRLALHGDDNTASYELVAVVCHHGGTPRSGHYTCYGRRHGEWYYFDDTRRSKLGSLSDRHRKVINEDGYMMFYTRTQATATQTPGQ